MVFRGRHLPGPASFGPEETLAFRSAVAVAARAIEAVLRPCHLSYQNPGQRHAPRSRPHRASAPQRSSPGATPRHDTWRSASRVPTQVHREQLAASGTRHAGLTPGWRGDSGPGSCDAAAARGEHVPGGRSSPGGVAPEAVRMSYQKQALLYRALVRAAQNIPYRGADFRSGARQPAPIDRYGRLWCKPN